MHSFHSNITRRGFTLIELMVVVAILATLVGLGAIGVGRTMRTADKTSRNAFCRTLNSAIMAYKNETGKYPLTSAVSNSAASYTYGTVSNNRPQNANAEVIMKLLGRSNSGRREESSRAYITDSSMLYVCKGGRRISKLDNTLANGSISTSDMIGFVLTMNKTKSSKYKEMSNHKAFAPVKITFDFDLDSYSVTVPHEGQFSEVIKIN